VLVRASLKKGIEATAGCIRPDGHAQDLRKADDIQDGNSGSERLCRFNGIDFGHRLLAGPDEELQIGRIRQDRQLDVRHDPAASNDPGQLVTLDGIGNQRRPLLEPEVRQAGPFPLIDRYDLRRNFLRLTLPWYLLRGK
jgi:hypothetical protein